MTHPAGTYIQAGFLRYPDGGFAFSNGPAVSEQGGIPVDSDGAIVISQSLIDAVGGGGGGGNQLGTPSNPVTSAAASRPTGLTVVYWQTTTQPTNLAVGDVWIDVS